MSQRAAVDVLVIEDEEHIAELLADVLGDEGYRVALAPDGLRGLEYVARYQPRLVLCDIMLPGLSGLEVLARLPAAANGPLPAVVLMSAAAPPSNRPPHVPFLSKPFNLEDLLACIREALGDDPTRGEAQGW